MMYEDTLSRPLHNMQDVCRLQRHNKRFSLPPFRHKTYIDVTVTSTDSYRFVRIKMILPDRRPATGMLFYAQRENNLTNEGCEAAV